MDGKLLFPLHVEFLENGIPKRIFDHEKGFFCLICLENSDRL